MFSGTHSFKIVMAVVLIAVFCPLVFMPLRATDSVSIETSGDSLVSFDVLFAGDAMVHSTQFNSAYNDSLSAYDFNPVFRFLKPYLDSFDLKVINLETTLGGTPYSGYPAFSSPDTFAYALKEAGFNYFALANNHSADKGKNGILRTIEVLNKYDIQHTGTFADSTDRAENYPYVFEINNIKACVLNYTYGTNGIIVPKPFIVNYIDTTLIRNDIAEARNRGAEAVMVYFHWGTEYQRQPGEFQKSIAAFTFGAGADIVIGSHPHVIQPFEIFDFEQDSIIKKAPIIWSLGNFVSNQRDRHTDGGVLFSFRVTKNIYTGVVQIANVNYMPAWVYRPLNPTRYYIVPESSPHKDSLMSTMSKKDSTAFDRFLSDTHLHLDSI